MHLAHLCLSLLIPSEQKAFSWSPNYCLLPQWLLHCFHTVHLEDGISVLRTERSQKEPYQENMGDEEGFQILIQSLLLWLLVTCRQGRSPARAEHRESVFLASFLWFSGVTASLRQHNMHLLSCNLASWTFLVLQQQQNLGRRFGTSKMHLSPPVA